MVGEGNEDVGVLGVWRHGDVEVDQQNELQEGRYCHLLTPALVPKAASVLVVHGPDAATFVGIVGGQMNIDIKPTRSFASPRSSSQILLHLRVINLRHMFSSGLSITIRLLVQVVRHLQRMLPPRSWSTSTIFIYHPASNSNVFQPHQGCPYVPPPSTRATPWPQLGPGLKDALRTLNSVLAVVLDP
ncbi:hypothetical protein CVT26_005911 [Gymnopilus dilepis]|uniref:Uncharacterized protein n=1 Tax=Gymnopilus dilepis TaxID=231916 RepID=A0A409Y1P2_9AGAR|nr:hypothetical protein CVT26_005911 [Gymnopilus dilepis]